MVNKSDGKEEEVDGKLFSTFYLHNQHLIRLAL